MIQCVQFVRKVPANIFFHGLLENMHTLQIQKER